MAVDYEDLVTAVAREGGLALEDAERALLDEFGVLLDATPTGKDGSLEAADV